MKLNDTGPDVLAYQRAHNLSPDGICGWDTLTRWRADNDPAMPVGLRAMARLIGVVTSYQMGADTPNCKDCSSAVCCAFGLPKAPGGRNTTGTWLSTGGMLADAQGKAKLFSLVPVADVAAGDLVIYGPHQGKAGHVAFVVDPVKRVILDCSRSQNGVHAHTDRLAQFWVPHAQRPVYGLRATSGAMA